MGDAAIRVRVRFFGVFRELAGRSEQEVGVRAGTTVRELVQELRRTGLGELPREPVAAVNLDYTPLDRPLTDGDEVALIPPVAGG